MFANNEETRRRRHKAKDIATRIEDLVCSISDPAPPPPANSVVEEGVLEAARREFRSRRERERLFAGTLVADPGWDILLDLFIAREEGRVADIAGVCGAVAAAQGAVLRSLGHLLEAKLVMRQAQPAGAESLTLTLTENGRSKMCDYFSRIGADEGAAAA